MQGIVTYAGIRALPFLAFQGTLTHGTSPNLFTIQIPPQNGKLIEGGSLVISYGGTSITLRDCKVDSFDVERNSDSLEVWTINILDRRWKWRMGAISGCYNVRRGATILPSTLKSVRLLCSLCLEAMGESRPDVSAVPNDQ